MNYRKYDAQKDAEAAHRIWREVGWIGTSDEEAAMMDIALGAVDTFVVDLQGAPECMVKTGIGTVRYLSQDLPMCAVLGVTTSRIVRKQGFGARLTAAAITEGVAKGAILSGLGMFEQGFYNRLGFGTGAYETEISFDPVSLMIGTRFRVPERITIEDWEAVHKSRLHSMRWHGGCTITHPEFTRVRMSHGDAKAFGLGYRDESGEITHHVWVRPESVGSGPYHVAWMAYQNYEQFMELMAIIRSWGDQVKLVKMNEPPDIQLTDFVRNPVRTREERANSQFQPKCETHPWWQMRICNLAACLEATHLATEAVHFNLKLSDPIAEHLPEQADWKGISGDYVVTLGPNSSAEAGQDATLPTLEASVNAFTRMWLGVRRASGLAVTDELTGPCALLGALDRAVCVPTPRPGWYF